MKVIISLALLTFVFLKSLNASTENIQIEEAYLGFDTGNLVLVISSKDRDSIFFTGNTKEPWIVVQAQVKVAEGRLDLKDSEFRLVPSERKSFTQTKGIVSRRAIWVRQGGLKDDHWLFEPGQSLLINGDRERPLLALNDDRRTLKRSVRKTFQGLSLEVFEAAQKQGSLVLGNGELQKLLRPVVRDLLKNRILKRTTRPGCGARVVEAALR